MRANDFLNEADEESRKDKAMAAAMANVMKQKADIDARNAEVEKQSNARASQYDVEYNEDDYKSLLAQHDWYYDYSDDHSVWQRGNRERDTLYKYQDAVDPDYKIWNEYAPEMFQRKMRENVEEKKKVKQRLDPKCWDGKKKDGTKIKGGVRVNNCVPK